MEKTETRSKIAKGYAALSGVLIGGGFIGGLAHYLIVGERWLLGAILVVVSIIVGRVSRHYFPKK